ncbi:uncharacterized protein LOC128672380 isoform X1 [Plodia interpunctella]|uniref:uncharacterized protein LOC128672380 isoform X1 n=1 Tax=Plodia interpunctella TaxID=58824 RepID=UPI002368612F|nr:uncharacterized protein LOC128672380 isoform X1 [Plodia interpunctella]
MATDARNQEQLDRNVVRIDNGNVAHGLISGIPESIPEELTGSSYTISSTQSQFSYAVDNWIRGNNTTAPTNNTNIPFVAGTIQSSRPVETPRPPLPPGPSNDDSPGLWYTLAMILPLLTMNNTGAWGCSARLTGKHLPTVESELQRMKAEEVSGDGMEVDLLYPGRIHRRCLKSTIFNAAQFFARLLVQICQTIRENLQNLAQDRMARDVFAAAMDVVLIIYAVGFLVLSMYQASIFN